MKLRARTWRTALLAIPLAALGITAIGCDEGPAEDLGEKIDHAGDKVSDKVHDATH